MPNFMPTRIFSAALLLAGAPLAHAQLFSLGLKLGTPVTETYTIPQIPDGGALGHTRRFTVGPTAEVHLPFHISIAVDALWRQSSFLALGAHIPTYQSSVNDWQFPLMVKHEVNSSVVHPFIEGGIVYRHVSVSSSSVPRPANPNTAGVAFGGGIMLKVLRARIAPELRYTIWTKPALSVSIFR